MEEKLIIRNFGPIKSIDLNLKSINIFIGDQGTGKSTIAKIIDLCKYLPSYYYQSKNEIEEQDINIDEYSNLKIKELFEYYDILDYYIPNETYIYYKDSTGYVIEFDAVSNKTTINLSIFSVSKLIENINNIVFIPIERDFPILFSSMKSENKSLIKQISTLENILKKNEQEIFIDFLDLYYKYEKEPKIRKKDSERYFSLRNNASGYQSIIPIILSIEDKIGSETTFIIEEPEISLFPETQKNLMEYLVYKINNGKYQFILTTHSPYILNALNSLIFAYIVGKNNQEKVMQIAEQDYWLNPNQISAYKLIFDDQKRIISENIIDKDLNEIDIEYLDKINGNINQIWDELLKIKLDNEKQ